MQDQNIEPIIALYSSGEFQDALTAIEELIIEESNEALLFNIKGACYAGMENLNLAKENYVIAQILFFQKHFFSLILGIIPELFCGGTLKKFCHIYQN